MTDKPNQAQPVIAVVEGYGVSAAIAAAGALTFDVDDKASAKLALTFADAIVLTGGGDVSPSRYGQKPHKQVYGCDAQRDKLEFWLVNKARQRGIPIMGICRGSQVLNVAHGGTLDQNIDDDPQVVNHWGEYLFVKLSQRSRLARSLGTNLIQSSHYHHQAVKQVGEGLRAIAWAQDGTVEAIESQPDNPHYVLGVQFHPEMDYKWDQDATATFDHFVWKIASQRAARRGQDAEARLTQVMDQLWVPGKQSLDQTLMDQYMYGSQDDYAYMEWQELNSHYAHSGRQSNVPVGMTCAGGKCIDPKDCDTYGDCAIEACEVRIGNSALDEAWDTALSEDDASEKVKQGKRGNRR